MRLFLRRRGIFSHSKLLRVASPVLEKEVLKFFAPGAIKATITGRYNWESGATCFFPYWIVHTRDWLLVYPERNKDGKKQWQAEVVLVVVNGDRSRWERSWWWLTVTAADESGLDEDWSVYIKIQEKDVARAVALVKQWRFSHVNVFAKNRSWDGACLLMQFREI